MTATSDVLRSVPLFQGMTDRSVEAIERLVEETVYPSGSALVRQGDPGDSFIVIVTGRATVDRGGQPIRELSGGDFLGEISLIDGGPRTATVTAIEPIGALVIQRDGFDRLMNEYPPVRLEILTALTQRLRARTQEISD